MSEELKDQVAVVTGGNSGIGRAIVRRLAGQGATVVVLGRNAERGAAVVKEVEEAGGSAEFAPVDVTSTEQVREAIDRIIQRHQKVDILVNNAGITRDGLLMKLTEDQWDDVLDTNLKSAFNTCQALVRAMMKARKGRIINISSVVGLTGNAGQSHYAASKSGLIGFSKSLARELASRNICVNCIAPGFIETPMTDVLTDAQKEQILNAIPLRRMGQSQEVAGVVSFLAGSAASYITGQVITIDGGMVM